MDFAKLESLYPKVEDPTQAIWYIHAGVVIEVSSHPEYIDGLWNYMIKDVSDEKTQLDLARRIRETFLKTCVLAGFPRVSLSKSMRSEIEWDADERIKRASTA